MAGDFFGSAILVEFGIVAEGKEHATSAPAEFVAKGVGGSFRGSFVGILLALQVSR